MMKKHLLANWFFWAGSLSVLWPGLAWPAESPRNPTLDTIAQRKSVRHYLNKPLTRGQLETLLKAGMAAPTAADKRPWAFVAVLERRQLQALAQALPYGKMLETAGGAVVVCGFPGKSLPGIESQYWVQDCSAASENILLAAEALGLGGVWIGVHPLEDRQKSVRQALGIPENAIPLNVIALGYPTGQEKPKDKYNPANIHWNQW